MEPNILFIPLSLIAKDVYAYFYYPFGVEFVRFCIFTPSVEQRNTLDTNLLKLISLDWVCVSNAVYRLDAFQIHNSAQVYSSRLRNIHEYYNDVVISATQYRNGLDLSGTHPVLY